MGDRRRQKGDANYAFSHISEILILTEFMLTIMILRKIITL